MKSFSLLTTNVGLTTNIKVMVTSDYKLSLDSIESDVNLSYDKFKKVSFNKDNYYDELIPYFYKDLPSEIAFKIKYDNDSESMSDDFKDQYDELYQHGARNISNNKNYKEEYEYFAPLYLSKENLPKNFIIFRVDGSGIGTLLKENFKTEILKKFKTVKLFDLTKNTPLGEWMSKNFIENKFFPDSGLDIDFRNLEFCRWNGIDYQNGGYTYKSLFIDDILDEEKEIFELEKFVFDSYRNNKVVFPNILNMSFLFDDTPSTPEIKRKWSINRYYGFYLNDLELVKTISPYNPVPLQLDVEVLPGNILHSATSSNPFVQDWSDNKPFYVEYNGNYYKVEQFTETINNQLIKVKNNTVASDRITRDIGFRSSKGRANDIVKKAVTTNTKSAIEQIGSVDVTKYRIISDISLAGLTFSNLNQNFGQIEQLTNRLVDADNDSIVIDGFDDQNGNIGVWIIEIDGIYHNIISDDNGLKLNTDYSFLFNQNDFTYKVGGESVKVETYVDFNRLPKKFSIYRLQFTDIKNFDNRIVDTDYSKYEYEMASELTVTDETKMYLENILSTSDPIELDDFIYKNEVVSIPTSSEYTANYETFKIDTELSNIWRKNPIYCRWGFNKSLSGNDLPYLLNNSLIFEDHNRTANVYEAYPRRMERNLDYFYTINSGSASYIHHSLHIQELDNNGDIDNTFVFDLSKYLNFGTYSNDYFTYFFKKKTEFYNGKIKKNVTKYSYFNVGDQSVPNHTIFRGIRFDIFEITNMSIGINGILEKINLKSSNKFNNYKFSILLSDNNYKTANQGKIISPKTSNVVDGLVQLNNTLQWKVIKEWRMDTIYNPGDIVIFNNILYIYQVGSEQRRNVPTSIVNTTVVPSSPLSQGFAVYNNTVFWNAGLTPQNFIYSDGEYYVYNNSGVIDFWNPTLTYDIDDIVLFKGKYYKSTIEENSYLTNSSNAWVLFETLLEPKWNVVQAWNPNTTYVTGNYVVYYNTLYKVKSPVVTFLVELSQSTVVTSLNDIPGQSDVWLRQYSIVPDSDFIYNIDIEYNSIIEMNNAYYLCTFNNDKLTLDNGLIIYINNKWKNVLVNINIADNTYDNISECNRDDLYNELYAKLTASNFSNAINDITNKYGFADYLTYVIIDEDGIKQYSNSLGNIKEVPYLLRCEEPERLEVKVNSLFKRPVNVPLKLTPFNSLNNGKIIDLTQLNYYNNIPIAANIIENEFPPKVYENYHGNKNIISNEIFRYSGYYSPVFYDIQLFESDCEYCKEGNYKFDTTLTDFGLMKERKIRKINRKGDILRLANENDEKSIYPMLDEFGYSIYDFFIFSSTWDLRYYLETVPLTVSRNYLQKYTTDQNIVSSIENIDIPINIPTDIGQSQNL